MLYWMPHCTLSQHAFLWESAGSPLLSLPSRKAFCVWRSRGKLLSLSLCKCAMGGCWDCFGWHHPLFRAWRASACFPAVTSSTSFQACSLKFFVTISYINRNTINNTALHPGQTEALYYAFLVWAQNSFLNDASPSCWLSDSSCTAGRNVQCLVALGECVMARIAARAMFD